MYNLQETIGEILEMYFCEFLIFFGSWGKNELNSLMIIGISQEL